MLTDAYARKFSYLRLSITDRCNFGCAYCLPGGYRPDPGVSEPELSLQEIENLIHGVALAGFSKIRITGGEPTLRRDLFSVIEAAASEPGIRVRALSTNGWNLREIASGLRLSGLTHLNVSVDSLDPVRFKELTGRDSLVRVLRGIDHALSLGLSAIKINAVLHRETAEQEIESFLEYVKTRPITVRFIELMRTQDRSHYRDRHFVSAGSLRLRLLSQGWSGVARDSEGGPALEFSNPDFIGRIGLIAPHSEGFCETCNRLRITSRGKLKLCLFGEQDESIRDLLQSRTLAFGISRRLQDLLEKKPISHELALGRVGQARNFSVMGG